ncbi:MAG: cytochrome c-type biogenesis protein CcmH [Chloroflexi bacterium]|nr:cytochrome c-type biogenesis protein CcmH [Chloroflexota bacterium]
MLNNRKLRVANYKLPLAILAVLIVSLLFAAAVFAQDDMPTDDEVNKIAKDLYCPVCESTPLDVCPTEACRQWRELIRQQLAEGKSEEEIKQYFVTQYGARVLSEPPNRLASYLVPALAFLAGVFLLFRGFRMWIKPMAVESASGEKEAAPIPQDDYIRRMEEELKKRK